VFAKAREKARQSSCASNLKQIGLALIQYETDYDENHMMWNEQWFWGPNPSDYKNVHWQQLVYTYVKSIDVFACPSNPSTVRVPALTGAFNTSLYPSMMQHYGSNVNSTTGHHWANVYGDKGCGPFAGGGGSSAGNNQTPFQVSQFVNPAKTIEVVEVMNDTTKGAGNGFGVDFEVDASEFQNNLFAGHTGQTNYLFCDGHVKSLRPTQTYSAGNNLWTIDGTDTCSTYGGNFSTYWAFPTLRNAETRYLQ
jgi:prepilin-type processing-associated H-X9-DG protein